MSDAPERIWLVPDFAINFRDLPGSPYDRQLFAPYILATPEALAAAPEVQALIAEAVGKERERIATGLAETVGVIDAGSPSCVSTACDLFNELETGWTLATIEDEHGNEQYSADNKRVLVSAIHGPKP